MKLRARGTGMTRGCLCAPPAAGNGLGPLIDDLRETIGRPPRDLADRDHVRDVSARVRGAGARSDGHPGPSEAARPLVTSTPLLLLICPGPPGHAGGPPGPARSLSRMVHQHDAARGSLSECRSLELPDRPRRVSATSLLLSLPFRRPHDQLAGARFRSERVGSPTGFDDQLGRPARVGMRRKAPQELAPAPDSLPVFTGFIMGQGQAVESRPFPLMR